MSLYSVLPDDAALVAVVPLHVEVTVVSDGKDVGRHFSDLLVGVEADLVGRVDGQQLVRVDGHQDGAGVRLHTKAKDELMKGFLRPMMMVDLSHSMQMTCKTYWIQ